MDSIAEAGFKELELMVTRDPRTQEASLPARLASERGLRITSVHGPFLVISKSVWGMDPIGKIERGVEMCRQLGASTLIVHPPFLWERAYARWLVDEAEALCAETGVAVAVETMYPKWMAGRRLRGYRWLDPVELAGECSHVVLDTSHLAVGRFDLLAAYETLRDKLVHVHLSDNAGDGRDGHLELDQGVLPIARFLGELRKDRYRGPISLELSVNRYLGRPRELISMLARNRVLVEDRMYRRAKISKGMPRP